MLELCLEIFLSVWYLFYLSTTTCDLTFGDLSDWNVMKYGVRRLCQGAGLFTHTAYTCTRMHSKVCMKHWDILPTMQSLFLQGNVIQALGKAIPMLICAGQQDKCRSLAPHWEMIQKYEPCYLAKLRSSHRHAKENNMHSNSVVNCTNQHLLHLPSGFEHIRAELKT